MNLKILISNSLRSDENNLIYFRKQLGNRGKPKFSVSRAVFLCDMLRGNKVFLSYIYLCLYNAKIAAVKLILLIWLNIIGWVRRSLLRCKYYHEYLACEEEDF